MHKDYYTAQAAMYHWHDFFQFGSLKSATAPVRAIFFMPMGFNRLIRALSLSVLPETSMM